MVEQLVAHWQSLGIPLNPGATEGQLRRLEEVLRVPVPSDVRAFYLAMNGMADGEYDGHQVHFWSIDQITSDEGEVHDGVDEVGAFHDVALADFLINSWWFNCRVRGAKVTFICEGTGEEFPNFKALLERYLSEPESLAVI